MRLINDMCKMGNIWYACLPIFVFAMAVNCSAKDYTSPDQRLQSLREIVYFNYDRQPGDGTTEIELKDKLSRAFDGKLDRKAIDNLFSIQDPAAFNASWDKVRGALESDGKTDWYLSARIDPKLSSATDTMVNVVCGCVCRRAKRDVTLEGKKIHLNIVYLSEGAVADRLNYRDKLSTSTVVMPSDMVVFREKLDSNLSKWEGIRKQLTNAELDHERADLCKDKVARPEWVAIGSLLFAQDLVATPPDSMEDFWASIACMVSAGEIEGMGDQEFMFALQHSGMLDEDVNGFFRLRAIYGLILDGDDPELGVSFISQALLNPPGFKPESKTPLYRQVYLQELNCLAATLGGISLTGRPPLEFKLDDTLLSKNLDRDRLRSAGRKRFQQMISEMKLRLFVTGSHNGIRFNQKGDTEELVSIANNSLNAYPNGAVVKVLAAQIFLQTGKSQDALRLLQDVLRTCNDDLIRGSADETMGLLSYQLQHYNEAIASFQTANTEAPHDADTLYYLLKSMIAVGNRMDAKEICEHFLEVEPAGSRADEVRRLNLDLAH